MAISLSLSFESMLSFWLLGLLFGLLLEFRFRSPLLVWASECFRIFFSQVFIFEKLVNFINLSEIVQLVITLHLFQFLLLANFVLLRDWQAHEIILLIPIPLLIFFVLKRHALLCVVVLMRLVIIIVSQQRPRQLLLQILAVPHFLHLNSFSRLIFPREYGWSLDGDVLLRLIAFFALLLLALIPLLQEVWPWLELDRVLHALFCQGFGGALGFIFFRLGGRGMVVFNSRSLIWGRVAARPLWAVSSRLLILELASQLKQLIDLVLELLLHG